VQLDQIVPFRAAKKSSNRLKTLADIAVCSLPLIDGPISNNSRKEVYFPE